MALVSSWVVPQSLAAPRRSYNPRALDATDDDTHLATLANGLRVLVLRMPRRQTLDLSVFVHTGSQHEAARDNGISHMVEHMAFKGTASRDCQRINLDAESLGAQVNAHTDKDHSAFHMVGLARDAPALLQMLADIVQHGSFPADELERERQVILHEYVEDEDDPLSVAFRLFDKLCWGSHPLAQPVIGQRRHIERFSRDELQAYVQRQYSAANTVVAVAGDVDPEAIARAARSRLRRHAARQREPRRRAGLAGRRAHARAGRLPADPCGAGLSAAVAAPARTRPAWWRPRCWARA